MSRENQVAAEAAQEVRSRYGDVVEAAEKARAKGDTARADTLMETARAILDRDRAQTVAQQEMDNYARGSFKADTDDAPDDEE